MSRRILLADDSVTIQKVIELTFMDDDYEVRAVGNGDEALAMLTALTVDFVIADVHMPGASGYEVCRRSKQLRPEVPVLLLVGTFEPFDEAQARECGANSYLKKPFDSQELLGRVHELLSASGGGAHQAATPAATSAGEPVAGDQVAAAPAAAAPVAAPATSTSQGISQGIGQGIRLTGGIEAAATWQEFELEAEPELIADPWTDPGHAAPSPAATMVPASPQHFEQPFALGDLEEQEATPAEAPAMPAAAAPPAGGATQRVDQPFTLGEPLDDRAFLLDEADVELPEPAAPASAPQLRATQAEPVSPFGSSHPAAPEPPAAAGVPAPAPAPEAALPGGLGEAEARVEEHAGHAAAASASPAESWKPAAAAGNGQPAAGAAGATPAAAVLGDQDVDRIARRVVELIGDKVVRDIAWEVIPDLAEVVIKDRLRELESQLE